MFPWPWFGSTANMFLKTLGAAAVLGAARAVGLTAPEGVEAHFIVAVRACQMTLTEEKEYFPHSIILYYYFPT